MACSARYFSPLGTIFLTAEDGFLTGAWFEGQKYFPEDLPPEGSDIVLDAARRWLDGYFSGGQPAMDIPLKPEGTAFQQQVWQLLLDIPYGQTAAYGDLACAVARMRKLPSMSAQAVGNAVGRNPISLFIPCHRCVGKAGALTGYAGGLGKKAALLALERESASQL